MFRFFGNVIVVIRNNPVLDLVTGQITVSILLKAYWLNSIRIKVINLCTSNDISEYMTRIQYNEIK